MRVLGHKRRHGLIWVDLVLYRYSLAQTPERGSRAASDVDEEKGGLEVDTSMRGNAEEPGASTKSPSMDARSDRSLSRYVTPKGRVTVFGHVMSDLPIPCTGAGVLPAAVHRGRRVEAGAQAAEAGARRGRRIATRGIGGGIGLVHVTATGIEETGRIERRIGGGGGIGQGPGTGGGGDKTP